MSRRDYVKLAEIVGRTLAAADKVGAREAVYSPLYVALSDLLAEGNPRFDRLRFAHAVATVELDWPDLP